MRNLLQPLAEIVLIPLGVTAATSTVDTGIHKKHIRVRTSFGLSAQSNTVAITA